MKTLLSSVNVLKQSLMKLRNLGRRRLGVTLIRRADQRDALVKMGKIIDELKQLSEEYVRKHANLDVHFPVLR